ncbi:MAG: hypothetical protein AB1635_15770 [Acidobacteriota bacterium]
MHTRFAAVAAAATLAAGFGVAALVAAQKPAAPTATSVVVYKSPT